MSTTIPLKNCGILAFLTNGYQAFKKKELHIFASVLINRKSDILSIIFVSILRSICKKIFISTIDLVHIYVVFDETPGDMHSALLENRLFSIHEIHGV